ncbi:MAG: YceD family protein [Nitrospiria bacterium]
MLIDVLHVPEEGKEISCQEDPAAIHLSPEFEFKGKVDVQAFLYRTGRTIMVRGKIEAIPAFECGRCSKSFFLPLMIDFDQVFVPKSPLRPVQHKKQDEKKGARSSFKNKAETDDLSREEEEEVSNLDENYYEGSSLSLDEMIREQVILAFPMRPLCSPGCKGLCPNCGANLNVAACSCSIEDEDRPGSMEKLFKKVLEGKTGE